MKGLTEMTITVPGQMPYKRMKMIRILRETILHLFPGRISMTLKPLSAAQHYFIKQDSPITKVISSTEHAESHFLL